MIVGLANHFEHQRRGADVVEILRFRVFLCLIALRQKTDHFCARQCFVEQLNRRWSPDVERDDRARKYNEPAHRQDRQFLRNLGHTAFIGHVRGNCRTGAGFHFQLGRHGDLFFVHHCFNGSEIQSSPLRCSACASVISTSAGNPTSRSNGP